MVKPLAVIDAFHVILCLFQEAVNKEREKLKQYIETKNIGQIFTKVSLYLEVVGDDR